MIDAMDAGVMMSVYSWLTARGALFLSCTSRIFRKTLRSVPEGLMKSMWLNVVFAEHPSHLRVSSTLPSLDLLDRCYSLVSNRWPLVRRIDLATRRVRIVDDFFRREITSSGSVNVTAYATALTILERELDEHMVRTMKVHPITSLCFLHALARSSYRVRSARKPESEQDVELVYFVRGYLDAHAPFRSRDSRQTAIITLGHLRNLLCDRGARFDNDLDDALSSLKILDAKCWTHAISGLSPPSLRLR